MHPVNTPLQTAGGVWGIPAVDGGASCHPDVCSLHHSRRRGRLCCGQELRPHQVTPSPLFPPYLSFADAVSHTCHFCTAVPGRFLVQ